jgi:hypothetical protein
MDPVISNQSMKPTGPFPKQVDSFTPALSAFGFPIYVAPLFAGSIQRVCHGSAEFPHVPGYPGAIHLFALTHCRRNVVQR